MSSKPPERSTISDCKDLLERHDQAAVNARLDAVYGDPAANTGLDPALAAMQWASIRGEPGTDEIG
jgi:hypothetical protein